MTFKPETKKFYQELLKTHGATFLSETQRSGQKLSAKLKCGHTKDIWVAALISGNWES